MNRHTSLSTSKSLWEILCLSSEHQRVEQRIFCLGVNPQTGRLQWCPNLTCCKLMLVFPVIVFSIAVFLVLVLRLDGILGSFQQHRSQRETDPMQALGNTDHGAALQALDYSEVHSKHPLQARFDCNKFKIWERNKRYLPHRYGSSEATYNEEREFMKDSQTSFIPSQRLVLPLDCGQSLASNHTSTALNVDFKSNEAISNRRMLRTSRSRRTSQRLFERYAESAESDTETVNSDAVHLLETTAALHSLWNAQGTKEGIRQTQANTMIRYMDVRFDPCVDFYNYACGNWEKLHPIPKDKAGFDTFEMLRESLDWVLKQLLEGGTDISAHEKIKTVDKQINAQTRHQLSNECDSFDGFSNQQVTHRKSVPISGESSSDREIATQVSILRRHIVKRRYILNRILLRYKRHNVIKIKRDRVTNHSRLAPNKKTIEIMLVPMTKVRNGNIDTSDDAQVKAKDMYRSCVDTEILAKRGLEPLHQLLRDLGGWPVLDNSWRESDFDWQQLAARLRRFNNDILIVQWVGPDIKNSDEHVIQFDQTSLGLPTREYFLQDVNEKYLSAYQRFMSEVMHKLGALKPAAMRTASEIVTFETQLATITAPAEERLNVTKLYKRMTLKELHTVIPQINWKRYLETLQLRVVNDSEHVIIYASAYMKALVTLIAEAEPRTVANYMMWRFVRHRINNVDDRFDEIKQKFYHALFGREETPKRWKVCVAQVNTNMGMAVGSMFVSRFFDENSKRDTLKITHELQHAFREILHTTDWLDRETRVLAEEKVNAMSLKIGYPDSILNFTELNEKYAGIEIHADKYFENTLQVLLHTSQTEQAKLNERVNKTNWQTAPAIVNAYYSRNKNQIMFPAGILQPPFYHRHFPKALNLGGIGVVIGHELTHGFDDKGRLFDSSGNIHKWWSDSSIRGFDSRARCIIAQYGNYTVDEVGIALNGESTQGENIADNGGLRQAFHAYKRWLSEDSENSRDESLPNLNLTGPQLFFLNFGQVWCGAMRPEAIRNKLNTAIHSPGRFRVIGTLSNSYDFAREFHCPTGAPMNPSHKCSVW